MNHLNLADHRLPAETNNLTSGYLVALPPEFPCKKCSYSNPGFGMNCIRPSPRQGGKWWALDINRLALRKLWRQVYNKKMSTLGLNIFLIIHSNIRWEKYCLFYEPQLVPHFSPGDNRFFDKDHYVPSLSPSQPLPERCIGSTNSTKAFARLAERSVFQSIMYHSANKSALVYGETLTPVVFISQDRSWKLYSFHAKYEWDKFKREKRIS